jgi:hypothetical protein
MKSKESQVKANVKFWEALRNEHMAHLKKLKSLKQLDVTVTELSGNEFLERRIEEETRALENIEKSLAAAKKMLAKLSDG